MGSVGPNALGRRDVENQPLGSLRLSIPQEVLDLPSMPANGSQTGQAVAAIIQGIGEEHDLDLTALRTIIVTAQLDDTVRHWQRELGEPEAGVSNQSEGGAAGKTLVWGTGAGDDTYSVILLQDYIAVAAVLRNPVAVGCLAHELGHVHDETIRRRISGSDLLESADQRDWNAVRRTMGALAWSEYAAERVGATYLPDDTMQQLLEFGFDYLNGVSDRLRELVRGHTRKELGLRELWGTTITYQANIFSQLGRTCATISRSADPEVRLDRFIDQVSTIHPRWGGVVRALYAELGALSDSNYLGWNENFEEIDVSVEDAFRAIGLRAEQTGYLKLAVSVVAV